MMSLPKTAPLPVAAVTGQDATMTDPPPPRAVLRVELDWALEPVLHDCASTGIAAESIRRHFADHPNTVVLGNSLEENVVRCAEHTQQFLTATQGQLWPRCPRHPQSHRLHPSIVTDVACWVCPEGHKVNTAIGAL